MRRRQPAFACPVLMTDERIGDRLWPAIERLSPGAAVVFRHHLTPFRERRALFVRVRAMARRRRLRLILAGPPQLAIAWRADGAHGRSPHLYSPRTLIRTVPVHHIGEIARARAILADAVFVSPAFATRSHPGARPLGAVRFGLLAAHATMPVIALGGMDRRRWQRLRGLGAAGWAAIDEFAR